MYQPASDSSAAFYALRNRLFLRILTTSVPSSVVVTYLIGLMLGLDVERLIRMVSFILGPMLVGAMVFEFFAVSYCLKHALVEVPGEPEGRRLERILQLPRRIEVIPYCFGWTVGGLAVTATSVMVFGLDRGIIVPGMVAAFVAALFLGPMLTMMLEEDLRPVALEQFLRNPKIAPQGAGFLWPRQRWFLPYVFGVAIFTMLIFSGIVLVTKFQGGSDRMLNELTDRGLSEARIAVQRDLNELVLSVGIPLVAIAALLMMAFGITGWMLARRQARSADAVESALRSLAAGSPRIPQWVATDESGDLAAATAAIASEMEHAFEQLRAMAAGDLGKELQGDSGLIGAFRESRTGLLKLGEMMVALSRGEVDGKTQIAGDLGASFDRLHVSFQGIVDQAQTIATGDLRKDVEIPGVLGQAIQRMTTNLRQMVGQTQGVSKDIREIVLNLQSAVNQLSTATTEQVAATTETANTMTEMAQTSAVSAERASELINQGEAGTAVVEEGGEAAETTIHAMSAISSALGKVATSSTSLVERVQRIDSIVETVTFLADQSSTLAINAAIEAARAGEAGKGFAVVAREIRALASDSRKAAGQIRELLGEIRERTNQVDGSVAEGSRTVEEGNRLVRRLGEVISQLGVTIHNAVGLMRQVESSARQHQAGVSQVSLALTNMQKASESIRDGARMLGDMSAKAHELATSLQKTAQSYNLPAST